MTETDSLAGRPRAGRAGATSPWPGPSSRSSSTQEQERIDKVIAELGIGEVS